MAITESNRKSVGRGGAVSFHVFGKTNEGLTPDDPDYNEDFNEKVEVLHGDSKDIKRWDKMAQANGQKYGVREIILSPGAELTKDQALRMAEIAMEAHGADGHRWALAVHTKPRADGSGAPHYHLLIEERNLETGKILDSKSRNQLSQMTSRLVEYEFGLEPQPGRYDNWVINRLRDQGRDQAADDIAHNLGQVKNSKSQAQKKAPSHP